MNHHSKISLAFGAVMAATLALTCACVACDVHAQATTDADAYTHARGARVRASEVGHATETWLELQRTNGAAAPALPTPGAQATLAYERYMNSFRSKIPESFGSALSGNGGASRGDDANAGSGAAQPPGAN